MTLQIPFFLPINYQRLLETSIYAPHLTYKLILFILKVKILLRFCPSIELIKYVKLRDKIHISNLWRCPLLYLCVSKICNHWWICFLKQHATQGGTLHVNNRRKQAKKKNNKNMRIYRNATRVEFLCKFDLKKHASMALWINE